MNTQATKSASAYLCQQIILLLTTLQKLHSILHVDGFDSAKLKPLHIDNLMTANWTYNDIPKVVSITLLYNTLIFFVFLSQK